MTLHVIDASVVVKWLLPMRSEEEGADVALALLGALERRELAAVQPVHWMPEVAAAVARLMPVDAGRAIALLDAMDLPVENGVHVLQEACRLSIKLSHHLFDTLYHAVALEHGGVLVTADRRYYRKAWGEGAIQLLADWGRSHRQE